MLRTKIIKKATQVLNCMYWVKTSQSNPQLILTEKVTLGNHKKKVHNAVIKVFDKTSTFWIAHVGIKFMNTKGDILDVILKLHLGELTINEAPEVFNATLDKLLDNGCFIDGNKLTRNNFISYVSIIINVDDLLPERLEDGLMISLSSKEMSIRQTILPLSKASLLKPFR